MFSQAKRGKRDPVGFLTPSTVGRGRSRAVCSFQKRRWLCSATDSTAASIPLPFTRAKTYKLNVGVDHAMLLPSLVHSNFFEAPEKVIYPVHNGRESYCPLSGMNDSQWAPGESGGDRPHRSTTTLKTFEGGRVIRLEGLVTGLVLIYMWIAPICPAQVDATNLQTQNSPDVLPKFRSLFMDGTDGWMCVCRVRRTAKLRTIPGLLLLWLQIGHN